MNKWKNKNNNNYRPANTDKPATTSQHTGVVRAPYNFIPLNKLVAETEARVDFDTYHEDRHTGYIELNIETKTPLYIRDTLNEAEIKQANEAEKKKEKFINPDFFSPAGRIRIPGSSLRGMTRTMVEMTSFGKFGSFEDKRLYYRGLADMSSLRKEYQSKMSSFDRNSKKSVYKMSAGLLCKRGLDYFIIPAQSFVQIKKSEARERIRSLDKEYKTFEFYKVPEGYIVVSGDMQNKKKDWFIKVADNAGNEIKVPKEDIQDYKDDKNRSKEAPNLLTRSKEVSSGVPCFYVKYKDSSDKDRVSFGHTGMFRLAYKKTIGAHTPGGLKNTSITDIAEGIFGNEKTFAGRVFFEDAFCEQRREDVLMGVKTPCVLSTPKPTTFQHYLEQPDSTNLAHYNSDTHIRGNKLYWHKSGKGWEQTDTTEINKHEKQYTNINPVQPKTTFTGRIRFENLSSVELGAMLFALDLPEGCCHKLGMGKPFGLGSIRITPLLFLSKRRERYAGLFAEWAEPVSNSTPDEYRRAFEKYVLSGIKESKSSLWENERMKELKTMLNFETKPSDEKTRYMKIEPVNEFKARNILPKPSGV